jgi:ATP-dependent Zn protease
MNIIIFQLKPPINHFIYHVIEDNYEYKKYTQVLDLDITGEPTEMNIKTNCPSVSVSQSKTYLPTMKEYNFNIDMNNNNNNNTVIICVTVVTSFIVIIIVIYILRSKYMKKYNKQKKHDIFTIDYDFGTDYKNVIDF